MPQPEGQAFASTLVPQLRKECHGRLGEVEWFRATWQHGGASTGFSTWSLPDRVNGHREIPCVVKLPIGYTEYFWTKRLGLVHPSEWEEPKSTALPTPRVLAAGFELGGYDLAWMVVEKFQNPPLAMERTESSIWELFETAAEFHAAAVLEMPVDIKKVKASEDWNGIIQRGLVAIDENDLVDASRWRQALEKVQENLESLVHQWDSREIDTWCHHDLHAHNAMRRVTGDPEIHGHCALIDLALVGPGSWIEDALYFERLHWGREELLCGIDPLRTLAATRDSIGLPSGEDGFVLADVRRVLMAASAPAFLRTEGEPVYLKAALGVIERLLPSFVG